LNFPARDCPEALAKGHWMIQRLIILGSLKEKPSSGYDIKKYIQDELGVFFGLENKSIYYPLNQMKKEGLVRKKETQGKNAKKYVYSITTHGEKEFLKLCKQTLLSQARPFIESDIALYFSHFINKKEMSTALRFRLMFLEKVKKWLLNKQQKLKSSSKNTLLLEHHFKLVSVEKEFIKSMIEMVNPPRRPKAS
jgi:DNA-binding PadR family transcriptional regulator